MKKRISALTARSVSPFAAFQPSMLNPLKLACHFYGGRLDGSVNSQRSAFYRLRQYAISPGPGSNATQNTLFLASSGRDWFCVHSERWPVELAHRPIQYNLDAVPPIHIVSIHEAADQLTTQNGGMFTNWPEPVLVANHVKARQCTELAEILLIYFLHIFVYYIYVYS